MLADTIGIAAASGGFSLPERRRHNHARGPRGGTQSGELDGTGGVPRISDEEETAKRQKARLSDR